MKRNHTHCYLQSSPWLLITLLCLYLGSTSCKQDHLPTISTGGHDYAQINLVGDSTSMAATRIDTNLSAPWGMAVSSGGTIWICCNHNGRCVTYDSDGNQLYSPVATPLNGTHYGASPNGIIFNNTGDFMVGGKPVYCICSTEDGALIAWNGADSTISVADRSASRAMYKGITIANDGTGNYIYATDFLNAKIDVYDKSFNYVTDKSFEDPTMPAGFAPFNISNIGGKLFVTYAKQQYPDFNEAENGLGNGYVDVFSPDGSLIKRFASQGTLNAPWGIAQAPVGFGQITNAILIANYGDGHITVFDTSGVYQGLVENNGNPIAVAGLCDISFIGANTSRLYFTAGPSYTASGLFGYLKAQ